MCSSNYIIQDGLGVEMLGSQLLPAITGADRRIVDVAASFVSRQLHLLLLNATGTSVRRYLLYDNVAIFPSTLSRLSSPIVTITGRGYVAATSSPFFVGNSPTCRITSGTVKYSVPATVINRTTILCTLAGSNTSLCSSDTVDIALFDTLFSTTQLAIPRYQQSQITSISPSTTTLSSSLSITSISVIGSGFVNSGILRCRFTAQSNATSSVSVDTVGTYVSSTLVYCSPPVFDDATRLYVNIACDGMIFTTIADSTLNLLAVVGTPYNITTSVTSISVTSAAVVALPTIVVSFIDDQSSPLQQTVTDRIEVVASFQGGLLVAQGALQLVNNVGVFTFSGMTLTSPLDETGTAVTFVATLLSGEATLWAARVPITVNSGSPNSLWLTNAPTVAAGIPESNRITVVEATVVDLAGNRVTSVTSSSNTTINATLSMQWELAPNIVFPDALYTVYPADEFQNLSEAMSSGIVTFSTFHVPNARGGYVMRFIVETNLTNSVGVRLTNQTSQLVPKCNAGNIRFIGDTACTPCPTNMVCPNVNSLATDYGNTSLLISVASGYARSTVYATTATACDPADACIGGTGAGACAAGYTGALCGLCEDSVYGRSIIGGNCVACNGSRVSGFLLFLVIVLICFTFILLTIGASQNWSVTMEPVVSIVLMVQHLHSVLGLGLTGFSFSQYFKDSMSYLGIFSTRVLDYYFSDCVLVDEGMTFYSKIAAYAAMPALALFLASISWLIVFISPEFLRFKGLRIERDKALQERREELIERLAKNQNQRRAVSTATSGGSSGGRRTFFLRETPMERLRRISDQAEVTSIEQELKNNLKVQGVLPLHDYRIFAAHSLQVVMLFTFHTIISYALSVFDCQDIDSGLGTVLSYLNEDFRVSCDSAEYQQFVGFGYAISILYFIFVPVMFLVLYAMHRRFRTPQVLQRRQVFYVMTIGLKTGSWYWTAVTLLRKGIQFAVAAVVSSPADAHVSVWLFVMQLIWLLKLKPYWNWSNTFLEAMSLSSCMIAGSLCILLESYTSDASQRAISAVILTVMLAPIPVFIFSATQKVWSSVREEIRALRFDSEEESSSCSDDEIETQHREVMAMIHTKKKNIAISNPSTKDNLTSGAPADVPVAVESHYQPHRPSLAQKKHALRNVSVAEYLRAEDESREAREEHEQQSRELQAANAALHQQQKGINAGQTFAEWRRHRQHQLLNSSKQPGSAASQQPNSIQQLAQPLRLTAGSAPVFLEINHSSSSSSSISEASNSLASSLDEAEIDNDETLLVLHPDNNADTRPLQHEQIRHLRSPAFPNGNSDDTVVVASEQNFEIARLSVNTRSIDHGEDARRVAAFRSAFALSHQRQRLGASSSLTDDIFDIL
ncbi:transmembrane protein, putative [Bodo saltans]|uniref:Transmembrane protein, putative n=1 Tax=Bodo saltans TaxID=75058 RepID=A0A0S4IVV0_BODSA|nr:transmembrane protein, putative [Bodo saltans]|eukprot:CUG02676.1 transmembrane protein, putative [Bodo saltans]